MHNNINFPIPEKHNNKPCVIPCSNSDRSISCDSSFSPSPMNFVYLKEQNKINIFEINNYYRRLCFGSDLFHKTRAPLDSIALDDSSKFF